MGAEQTKTDDDFETLLRQTITDSVIGGLGHGMRSEIGLVARLRHYERRAHQEQLSSQTLQVIASARRLLGERLRASRIRERGSR
jgi:hypothetical protein